MARPVSLFGIYKQPENAVTNYVGVLMRLLYEESPVAFQSMVNDWLESRLGIVVGPQFLTQQRTGTGIPDLLIEQRAFSVRFETKLGAHFGPEQLKRHAEGFRTNPNAVHVLVALGTQDVGEFEKAHAALVEEAAGAQIQLVSLSFEELLDGMRTAMASESFHAVVKEFAGFLDHHGLLPHWRSMLTVVNQAWSLDEFERGAYMCPNSGGSYSHQRARFFGAYRGKTVSLVAEVRARVVLSPTDEPVVDWYDQSTPARCEALVGEARSLVAASADWRQEQARTSDLQVFLLGPRFPTDFKKATSGGLVNSRIYFRGIAKDVASAEALAQMLKGKSWSDFGR